MNNTSNVAISHYKVLSLPSVLEPNSVYYVLDQNSSIVEGYITSRLGVALPLFNTTIGGNGNVNTVTGTGVTGTSANPKINISTFVSTQLGNLIRLSEVDGKLQVNPIVSPDGSINITSTNTKLQLKLSSEIAGVINTALQPGDNISTLVNNGDGSSPYVTETMLTTVISENKDKNYYHDQAIPSDVWNIIHNLGKKPSVSVLDTAGTEVEGEVRHISINEVKIMFSAAFSGNATLN